MLFVGVGGGTVNVRTPKMHIAIEMVSLDGQVDVPQRVEEEAGWLGATKETKET